ncbi:MAG: hypothetical protein ABJP45_06795 [Cyclobacteriaceae bacterium]
MRKKKFMTLWLAQLLCLPLLAQLHFETGINLGASARIVGVGAFLEPRYAVNNESDLALHLGLNAYLGDDQSRTQSRRITSGTIPVLLASYIRRFPKDNVKAIPYAGFGPGMYLTSGLNFRKGIKLGAGLRFGLFIGRSNLGFTYNFIQNDSFFQISYGFRILDRVLR